MRWLLILSISCAQSPVASLLGFHRVTAPTVMAHSGFGSYVVAGPTGPDGVPLALVGTSSFTPDGRFLPGGAAVLSGETLETERSWEGHLVDGEFSDQCLGPRLGNYIGIGDVAAGPGKELLVGSCFAAYAVPADSLPARLDGAGVARIAATEDGRYSPAGQPLVADFDGDGMGDLAFPVRREFDSSHVVVIRGPLAENNNWNNQLWSLGPDIGPSQLAAIDWNQDGFVDIVVPDRRAGQEAGSVYVFHGPLRGDVSRGDADVVIDNTTPEEWFGDRVWTSPDLDGDGAPELLVSSTAWPAGTRAGRVLGLPTGSVSMDEATFVVEGVDSIVHLGVGATVADFTGDGQVDLILGAASFGFRNPSDPGHIYLFEGPLAGRYTVKDAMMHWVGEDSADMAGQSLAAADMDADGTTDLLVGAGGVSLVAGDAAILGVGAVYLVPGPLVPAQAF